MSYTTILGYAYGKVALNSTSFLPYGRRFVGTGQLELPWQKKIGVYVYMCHTKSFFL